MVYMNLPIPFLTTYPMTRLTPTSLTKPTTVPKPMLTNFHSSLAATPTSKMMITYVRTIHARFFEDFGTDVFGSFVRFG